MGKSLRTLVAGAVILTTLVGGMYFNSRGDVETKRDVVYQGYHANTADGYNLLVFDDNTRDHRAGRPDVSAIGNPNGLKIGKEYNVEVMSKRWFGSDEIKSIKPSDTDLDEPGFTRSHRYDSGSEDGSSSVSDYSSPGR